MGGWMAGMGLWGLLLAAAVLAALALAVLGSVWLVLRLPARDTDTMTGRADGARERLRQRYAAGEIDDEEYERRLAVLTWR